MSITKENRMSKKIFTYGGAVLMVALLSTTAQAAPNDRSQGQGRTQGQELAQVRQSAVATPELTTQVAERQQQAAEMRTTQVDPQARSQAEGRKEAATAKLDGAKLKACQAREKGLERRSETLVKRVEKIAAKFDKIAGKVDTYYFETLVPAGKSVDNYANLKADIETQKVAAQTALASAKQNLASFSCEGADPKGTMAAFRTDIQAVNAALKEYRTAVKDLIVAVRTASGDMEEAASSPTATPESNN
jgi:hypothetical protein